MFNKYTFNIFIKLNYINSFDNYVIKNDIVGATQKISSNYAFIVIIHASSLTFFSSSYY